jgi:hypothetical protein
MKKSKISVSPQAAPVKEPTRAATDSSPIVPSGQSWPPGGEEGGVVMATTYNRLYTIEDRLGWIAGKLRALADILARGDGLPDGERFCVTALAGDVLESQARQCEELAELALKERVAGNGARDGA